MANNVWILLEHELSIRYTSTTLLAWRSQRLQRHKSKPHEHVCKLSLLPHHHLCTPRSRDSALTAQMEEGAKEGAQLRAELVLTRQRLKELDERNNDNRDTLVAKLEK